MAWQFTPYIAPLLVAAAIALALAVYAGRRRGIPGVVAFALLMLAVAEYALANALELLGVDLPSKLLAADLAYIGLVAIPPCWLIFALQYTGRERRLTRPALALLALFSLLTLALVWTNDAHGLMRGAARLELSGPYSRLAVEHGPWWWVQAGVFYLMLLIGTALLVREMLLARSIERRQLIVLLPAVLAPWAANIAYLMRLEPLPELDLTPFAFVLTGLGFAWMMFRWRMLDRFLGLIPVARAAIVERMPDPVLVLDARGRIVDLNPAAGRLIGRPESAIVGRPASEVFDHWPALLTDAGTGERHADLILGEGPSRRDYDLIGAPLRHWHGGLAGALIVCRDITERKRAAAVLGEALARERAARDEARAAVSVRDEFLAVAAHELRTPLTVLKGYAQLLRRQLQEPALDRERLAAMADQLTRQLARFEALNDDLLDVAQLRAGRLDLRLEPTDLAELARHAIARFEHVPERRPGHTLTLAAPEAVAGVVDPDRLDRALTNIISNALKYSPGGGEVCVRVGRRDGVAEVIVSDQGIGMAPEEQARLFQPFARAESVRDRIGGVGLGLYITGQIVERHGGCLEVRSAPGQGTSVTVRLPLAGPPASLSGPARTGVAESSDR
jgi:PAS domain S-box-containing protein